ncbi:MAG: tetratricopeptide repeat protein [Clostridiales bacterium]|nr:tetratricopeptide repeat protein [Clostridiales bacterium]
MGKITRIDLSADRLLSVALQMADDHNYIGALKMLNNLAGRGELSLDALSLYAEIYDDLGLYEKCINGWFLFLDSAITEDLSDCYEGIAVSFMNLGMENFAAFYYNKLLEEANGFSAEERESILRDFLSTEENPLKFAYPPAVADCTQIISEGVSYMKAGDFGRAVEEFEQVEDENPSYMTARNYIAMCKIVTDKIDEAEQECKALLKRDPNNIQAMTTLAACYSERGEVEAAAELARRLVDLDVEDQDEIYKIATVCCENRMHKEAYAMFSKLSGDIVYDKNIMYFRAVAAYNSGKLKEAFDEFDRLLTIYPDAVIARHSYEYGRAVADSGAEGELSYFYRLPQEMREENLSILSSYLALPKAQANKLYDPEQLEGCINWCFDEVDGAHGGDLQRVALMVAVKAGLDYSVAKYMLDAFLPDEMKIELLTAIIERNEGVDLGVVICNVHKNVSIDPLNIGRAKRKQFLGAYANLCSHFVILDAYNGYKIKDATERVYSKLKESDNLNLANDSQALAAAIYIKSGVREAGISGKKIYHFFDITQDRVDRILEVL